LIFEGSNFPVHRLNLKQPCENNQGTTVSTDS
jgi:hypothetical protein